MCSFCKVKSEFSIVSGKHFIKLTMTNVSLVSPSLFFHIITLFAKFMQTYCKCFFCFPRS